SWSGTVTGRDPGFRDIVSLDVRPREGSALIGHSADVLPSPSGHVFPSPLRQPVFVPPMRRLEAAGSAAPRLAVADIGAYERSSLLGSVANASAPREGADAEDSDAKAGASSGCAVAGAVDEGARGGEIALLGLIACAGARKAGRRGAARGGRAIS